MQMLSNSDTQRFLEDVKKLDLKFPVATIAKETGYSTGNVSEYLSGKREPTERFLKKFYKSDLFKDKLILEEPEVTYNYWRAETERAQQQLVDMRKEIETLRSMISDKDRLIQTQDELIEMLRRAKEKNGDNVTNKNMQPG